MRLFADCEVELEAVAEKKEALTQEFQEKREVMNEKVEELAKVEAKFTKENEEYEVRRVLHPRSTSATNLMHHPATVCAYLCSLPPGYWQEPEQDKERVRQV